jgi:hypothetical protein
MIVTKILFNYFSDVERWEKFANSMGGYIAEEEVKQRSFSAILVLSKLCSTIDKWW